MNFLVLFTAFVSCTYIQCQNSPLILTTLIQENQLQVARNAATVHHPIFQNIQSYSGYFTVNKQFDSNLFFWFFPASQHYENLPVLLWLHGGPGVTSLLSVFFQAGPFKLLPKNKLAMRKYSWTRTLSIVYIDNPVGTGFSFTNNGYARNVSQIGNELYRAVRQFFGLFPELKKNDFYVTGESYAGKYISALCRKIHVKNALSQFKINLKGFAIGNGFIDPINQIDYSDFLYYTGLVDHIGQKELKQVEIEIKANIRKKRFREAFFLFDKLINADLTPYPTLLYNLTGFTNNLNYLVTDTHFSDRIRAITSFVNQDDIRRALHVGNIPFGDNNGVVRTVEIYLIDDFMTSVAQWMADLLSHYRGLLYVGQLDIIAGYPLVSNYLDHLNFSSALEFKTAKRYRWIVDGKLAGYVKIAGNLTFLLVRNAGHLVPKEQPTWAWDMINRFANNLPFH